MTATAPQIQPMSVGEARLASIDFTDHLDAGELLTGTPTIAVSPSGPTISNVSVSTAALAINGRSVIAGQAIQFLISGVTAGTTYICTATAATNSTPAETVKGAATIRVDA